MDCEILGELGLAFGIFFGRGFTSVFWVAGMGNLTLPNDDGRGQTRAQSLILGEGFTTLITYNRKKDANINKQKMVEKIWDWTHRR